MTNPFAKKLAKTQPSESVTQTATQVAAVVKATETKLGNMFAKAKPVATPTPPVPADEPEELDLDSLSASLEAGDLRPAGASQFDDEVPATKPIRDLPADLDKSGSQFVELLDGVYEILYDPELLGNVIRNIMIELKANPQYMKMVHDDDIRTLVKAMRNSMGLARIRKQEKSEKRKSGGSSKGGKAIDSDMEDAFAELGIDLS